MELTASRVNKSFGKIHVLHELDFHLPNKHKTAILGPSGSGKTTLLSVLAGLEPPDSGSVTIHGENIFTMTQEELTSFRGRHLSIVFQEFHLINALTAWENVSLPLDIREGKSSQKKAKKLAQEYLDMVGLSQRRNHYPHQLSGGEKQRVAIARALVSNPSILYADEPTGSLDENTAGEVESLMFDLIAKFGVSLLLITHNRHLASLCDTILELHHGSLAPAK